ncbi:hypothetical protein CANARDRAFT_27232 [[Candida] arabinofermentans NRRL YB-2248]|uniref:Pre-rRNA processing protein n=1 Tax=[Candida] arabinofermentans NRRL YB-2248 TaxID=983967 RepID=A0A1E4T528_9ASCO|nr:hypothetical protein CANARDRAFT_27232 [[Candida] arabinofermentans NRRL YB-2248]
MTANESTPLLTQATDSLASLLPSGPSKKSVWKRYKLDVWIPIILISAFLVTFTSIFFIRVEPNLGDYVAQGTTFDSDQVKFLGVDDQGGINLQVKGTSVNNYTNIEDSFARFYFKTGGLFVRKLNLKIDDLDLIVFDETKGDYKNLGKVQISPFAVKIVDGKETDLNLFLTVFPKSGGVLGIIKRILLAPKSKLRLKGDASVKILVFNGYIPITNLLIPLDLDIPTSLIKSITSDNVRFQNVELEKGEGNGMNCNFNVLIDENPIENLQKLINFPQFSIPELDWNLRVDDCNELPSIKLASLKSSNFEIVESVDDVSFKGLNISVSIGIANVGDDLTKRCNPEDELDITTPMSMFVDNLVNNNIAHVVIAGNEVSNYPETLSELFQKVQLPINLPVNTTSLTSKFVHNVTVENLTFEMKDGSTPVINGDLKIFIKLGTNANIDVDELSVDKIGGGADLLYQGSKFSNLTLVDWNPATTTKLVDSNDDQVYLYVESPMKDILLDITDMVLFQKIVQDVFSSGGVLVDIDALVNLMITCPFGEFEIDDIEVDGSTVFAL